MTLKVNFTFVFTNTMLEALIKSGILAAVAHSNNVMESLQSIDGKNAVPRSSESIDICKNVI